MSMSFRTSGVLARLSLLSLAALATAGLAPAASAQVAPQLIPYTSKLIAGGATTSPAKGTACPLSGNTSLDAYGDGCFATEIALVTPRYAIADTLGNVFFSDYYNGLIRRIDVNTGVVTAVAGGATSSPAKGIACGANFSIDTIGDGCLSTAVKLGKPAGLAFDPNGNLYFADPYNYNVRKIAATSKFITTGGIITLVDGNGGGVTVTYGYDANNTSCTTVGAAGCFPANTGFLDGPYSVALDATGNILIADEYTNAVLAVNPSTATTNPNGIFTPTGTVSKVAGAYTGNVPNCVNGSGSGIGCKYGTFTGSGVAITSQLDAPYAVAADTSGNTYFANEFINGVGKINSTGTLTLYAGTNTSNSGTVGKILQRGPAGSFSIGSDFGIAADALSNVYVTDALNGVIWRIDGAGQSMYPIAGAVGGTGNTTFTPPTAVCTNATDTFGDGCPALQTTFGKTGSTFATAASPGIYGVTVDAYSDLFVGDTINNNIREIASGTQFGTIGANQPTNIVELHFAAGDTVSTYTLTAGATNFSLGTISCGNANSDGTTDCLLPITATPTVLGLFTGTLTVTSKLGGTNGFYLSGIFVQSPVTLSSLTAVSATTSCGTTSTYATTAPITLTARLSANGPAPPTGSFTFYANNGTTNTAIGTVNVTNIGTSANVVYGAVLTYTFTATGTYKLTAVYSGDTYFKTSTGTAPGSLISSNPLFTIAPVTFAQSTIVAGQTALYSFTTTQNVYAGNITFAVTGLPANSTATFSPTSITASGCSTSNTVTLSVLTNKNPASALSGFGGSGRGLLPVLSILAGLGLALMIGLRRRRSSIRFGQLWMALALLITLSGTLACGNHIVAPPATPTGTYTLTVTAVGSVGGAVTPITFPLIVK